MCIRDSLNTPNIGVLTAETGQIFAAGEPIHLEGYAHAFEEQVTKIEFSFDHGATWVEVPITDSDNAKWVYWKMDIDSFVEPGSYLVELLSLIHIFVTTARGPWKLCPNFDCPGKAEEQEKKAAKGARGAARPAAKKAPAKKAPAKKPAAKKH